MNQNYFPIDSFNLELFSILNASSNPRPLVVALATYAADYAIYFLPLLLAGLWLWGNSDRRGQLVSTFLGAELALGLNQIAGLIWFHPRPFMVPVGNTLVEHVADSSFPSDHVTFMAAIAIGLWWLACERIAAGLAAILTILVAWSRIYLGVHFPFDMAGGLLTAVIGMLVILPFRPFLEGTVMDCLLLPTYRWVFSAPIAWGWCRS